VDAVRELTAPLHKGDAIYQMMQVTGEEGVSLDDFVTYQKAVLLDMVYLQQDGFDPVDASTPRERQTATFELLRSLLQREYAFTDRDEARAFFTQLTGLIKISTIRRRPPPSMKRIWRTSRSRFARWGGARMRGRILRRRRRRDRQPATISRPMMD
jgi:V/A-type H+-transporting ATPase subunit A